MAKKTKHADKAGKRAPMRIALPPEELDPAPYMLRQPLPGVKAAGHKTAFDSAMASPTYRAAAADSKSAADDAVREGLAFLGYPYLTELTQRAEYRRPAEILAKEMTRKWIRLQATGEEDKSDKIKRINAELERIKAQATFRAALEQDGYFGLSHVYVDTGDKDLPDELVMPLVETPEKMPLGKLKGLRIVEPIWCYPDAYNADDPLADDFYRPKHWHIMGRRVHASRLLTVVSRPVPQLLKPAYMFGGLSLSQIAKPYIDNWLRTRQSVSDLIRNFSIAVLKTNMEDVLGGGASDEIRKRAQMFNQTRDNRGLMVCDKESEEVAIVSAPLSGLDHLQAQSQEHMSAVTGIPLVILLGITPTGLNASSEGEIRVFYAWIEAQQESVMRPHLQRLLNLIQLSLFGSIDPEIGFVFEPLWAMDEEKRAMVRKIEAEIDVALTDAGIISPQESRQRLAAQEDSPYHGLDPNDLPDPPEDDSDGGLFGGDPLGTEDDLNGNPPPQAQRDGAQARQAE